MKIKSTRIALIAAAAVFAGAAMASPVRDDSWRVVKRAVQKEKSRPSGHHREARSFKILILDEHDNEELKITIPLSLVEGIIELVADEHFKCNGREYDIDLSDILDALKKGGPTALVEISGDDGLIKIWIE